MKGLVKSKIVVGAVVAIAVLVGAMSAQAKMVPKIDNFIIFPDQSGSMYMKHQGLKGTKMVLAKQLLTDMNELIPELGYKGSLYLFAPFQQILAPAVYKRTELGPAIKKIKDDQEIFGRLTPMGPGINQLDRPLASMSGKTAVIMLSDGKANLGADPVVEATQIRSKFPNVCFHVISFAEDKEGKATLEQVARLGNCIMVDASDLLCSRANMEKFVRDVFYDEIADQQKKDEVMVLRGIQFDFDKSNIKAEWKPILDEGARILKDNSNMKVVVEGHTDAMGSDQYNQKLSERRAKAVEEYFVSKGIAKSRMTTKGYGESKPIATNATEDGRALNRRVELKVVK